MTFINDLLGKICALDERPGQRTESLPTILLVMKGLWLQYGSYFCRDAGILPSHMLRCGVEVLAPGQQHVDIRGLQNLVLDLALAVADPWTPGWRVPLFLVTVCRLAFCCALCSRYRTSRGLPHGHRTTHGMKTPHGLRNTLLE
jgi:hypothetical protein